MGNIPFTNISIQTEPKEYEMTDKVRRNIIKLSSLVMFAPSVVGAWPCWDTLRINTSICIGCGSCRYACPIDIIELVDDGKYQINHEACIMCYSCWSVCPKAKEKAIYTTTVCET